MADDVVELYRRHRPKSLDQLIGQAEAVASLTGMLRNGGIPHAVLLSGPSGTGKTTIARILKTALKCGDMDFFEINCASCEPMATVRELIEHARANPWQGPCRVWLLDEAQAMSRAGFAQQGLLKLLEDTPKTAYFFLATTAPEKLHHAIRTRCTEIRTKSLGDKDMALLVSTIAEKEGISLGKVTLARLIEVSDGSPRLALVNLGKIAHLGDEEDQLALLSGLQEDEQPRRLGQLLMNPRSTWPEIVEVLRGLTDNEESIRRAVLNYANAALLNGAARGATIIQFFNLNFVDSGRAGLTLACRQVFCSK